MIHVGREHKMLVGKALPNVEIIKEAEERIRETTEQCFPGIPASF